MFVRLCCHCLIFCTVWKKSIAIERREDDNYLSAASQFEDFIKEYNRTYADEAEKAMRFVFFQENLREIDMIQRAERGTAIYGVNQFSDLSKPKRTPTLRTIDDIEELLNFYGCEEDFTERKLADYKTEEEFLQKYTSEFPPMEESEENSSEVLEDTEELSDNQPKSFDWRRQGPPGRSSLFVGPVKDQGTCSAGWAFAAVAVFEILYAKKMNRMFPFSEQQVIDCTYEGEGVRGCSYGLPLHAFEYMKETGLLDRGNYAWRGNDLLACQIAEGTTGYQIQKYFDSKSSITSGERTLYKTIPKSPVTVRINMEAIKNYKTGIAYVDSHLCKRRNRDANHAMTVIGYGIQQDINDKFKVKDTHYFILRNSYGHRWGEGGYIRIKRGHNVCGIGNWLNWATVA